MARCEFWLGEPDKAAEYYKKLGKMFPELQESLEVELESQVSSVLTENSVKKVWPTLSAWRQARRKSRASTWLKDHQQDKAAAEEKRWGKQIGGLRCSIEMEETSLRIGDQFNINVKIKNVSDKSITFYYQHIYQAEKLVFKDEKGQVVIMQQTFLKHDMPHPKEYFSTIKPGEVFSQEIKGRVTAKFVRAKDLFAILLC
jgi:acyl-CoA thioesterase FadM